MQALMPTLVARTFLCVLLFINVFNTLANIAHGQYLINPNMFTEIKSKTYELLDPNIQLKEQGYFDVVEKPEQFFDMEEIKIAPNSKRNRGNKSPAHVQQLMKLATLAAASTSDDDVASGERKIKAKKNLPALLFNNDLKEIHDINAKNIENDSRHSSLYERNTIVEPTLPIEKISAKKKLKNNLKGVDSYGILNTSPSSSLITCCVKPYQQQQVACFNMKKKWQNVNIAEEEPRQNHHNGVA
ncbi:uncharacterized protein LOC119676165 [Teleopsis dalmanni]|uniref:uncharacterized protein LOC119676165 n=1 Tax=Teleopsis dalmanni TaxID=139649 RepID=UPI0018CDF185|nr:uncharacterized protein LOC119676165 [Teleopsis dalmanni]